ncbi:hypothetical protein NQ315_014830, partial [Exocentrus adspersus]
YTYFTELSTKYKSSTLWTYYSILRSTITLHQDINLENYKKLRALLKRKSEGFLPKGRFYNRSITPYARNSLSRTSDNKYLATKLMCQIQRQKFAENLGTVPDNFYKICKTYTVCPKFDPHHWDLGN